MATKRHVLGTGSLMLSTLFALGGSAAADVASPLVRTNAAVAPYAAAVALDAARYASLKSAPAQTVMTDFVLGPDRTASLVLSPRDPLAEDGQLVVGSAAGDVPMPRPDVLIMTGRLLDDPGSLAIIGFSPLGTNGYIQTSDGVKYIISPGPHGGQRATVVYNLADVPEADIDWVPFRCGADMLPPPTHRSPETDRAGGGSTRDVPCRRATFAVDSDYEYTAQIFGGDINASAAYALTLFAGISEVYVREVNTDIVVGYLRVWSTDTDPYSGPYSYDRLFQFQDWWNANMGHITRNAVHLLSALRDGQIGGVAYYPGLCDIPYGYGLSAYLNGYFPYPLGNHLSQNWDMLVTTHEIGHNFGAPHTHDKSPPIDNCAFGDCSDAYSGTIMSYCHTCPGGVSNISLNLHPRIINEDILPYLDFGAPCNLLALPPGIIQFNVPPTAAAGGSASLSVFPSGTGPFNYQWKKNGVDIPGAIANPYDINPVTPASEGTYTVIVEGACGRSTESEGRFMDVTGGLCPGDYNADTSVDDFDFFDFLNDFNANNSAADVNGDTSVDDFDFFDFMNAFNTPC
ncbi:MAG: hypothetical protein JNM07_03845 [Phycisphaerae bacterium]|nr:hypothetical protein [Phycisphaerae bacterium]